MTPTVSLEEGYEPGMWKGMPQKLCPFLLRRINHAWARGIPFEAPAYTNNKEHFKKPNGYSCRGKKLSLKPFCYWQWQGLCSDSEPG